MQLKTRKCIKNTKKLPKCLFGLDSKNPFGVSELSKPDPSLDKYANYGTGGLDSSAASGGAFPWQMAIEYGLKNAQGLVDSLTYEPTSSDDIKNNQSTSYGSYGGVQYKQISNNIDESQYLDNWSTKSALTDMASGNIIGGALKFFGVGKSKQEEQLRKAREQINIDNQLAQSNAFTQYWTNRNKLEQAYEGRDARSNSNKRGKTKLVNTAQGKQRLPQNAWVSKNEQIVDTLTGEHYKVKNGPGDTAPAYLRGRDAVLTNSTRQDLVNPQTGNSFANDFSRYAAAGRLQELLDLQKFVHNRNNAKDKKGYIKAKDGKIPEIKPWEILASRLPAIGSSLAGFINARKQPTSKINSYVPNTYANMALPELAGLRVNSQPMLRDIDDKYRTYLEQLNSQSSLTAGQKQLYQMAAMNNSQMAKAKVLADAQDQNNSYIANWANAAINVGDRDAANRIQTTQYDKQYMDKALSARNKVANSFLTDMYNQSSAMVKDLMNSRTLNAMLKKYQQ